MVLETPADQHVTREQVEERLGARVDRRRWTKVDKYFNLHPQVIIELYGKNQGAIPKKTEYTSELCN